MNNYMYLNKIIIEAAKEWPKPPIVGYEGDNDYDYFLDIEPVLTNRRKSLDISDIDLSQWKVTMHYEYIERFKKVAAVVGEEKATEVLRALDG